MAAFEEMGVMPEIGKAIEELDWMLPTDVQAEAIPLILGGGDVLMAAETGSGKTGAFCLPICQIVWESLRAAADGKFTTKHSTVSPEWTLSFWDRDHDLVVTPDGLRCQSRHPKEWHGCRATKGVMFKSKYYFETSVIDEGLCRVGWSTSRASRDLGTCKYGFGFGGTGKKSNHRQFDDYGEPFGKGDVIGCLLDLDNKRISFSKNGSDLGQAFSIPREFENEAFAPAVVLKNAEMSFNFGASPFKFEPESGFMPVCRAPSDCVKTLQQAEPSSGGKVSTKAPQALIIEPSRELAEQTFKQLKLFMGNLKSPSLRIALLIGGENIKLQCASLNEGIDIVVATPGRCEDLIASGYLSLSNIRFFVLDEADGLLKSGYQQMIERMHAQIPKLTPDGRRLQMIVCSATLHAFEVKKLAERLMHFPTWVDLKGEDAVPETVHHVVVPVDPTKDISWQSMKSHVQTDGVHFRDKVGPGVNSAESLSEATKILKAEYCVKAIFEHKMDRAIIFCRTKLDCDNLERHFNKIGGGANNPRNELSCVCLHGDRKPNERRDNLALFKDKKVNFLICTDVAARGLDISGLPFMINITLPDEKSNYVHRIGRVGRADRMGLAISLVSSVPEKVWYHGEWCASRGRNCHNTKLTDDGGCCVWYNEMQYLADIEDHLNVTIQQIQQDMKVPKDEFDGKVVYGQKRQNAGSLYENHVTAMAPTVKRLAELETQAQLYYLQCRFAKQQA